MKSTKTTHILHGQEGSVLIVALIMLALLSIIGFAATTTSRLDIRIATNEYVAKQNLYAAESAAMELVQRIDNGGDEVKWLDASSPDWLVDNLTGQNKNATPQPTTAFDPVNDEDFPDEIIGATRPIWNTGTLVLARPSSFVNHGEALGFHLGIEESSLTSEAGATSIYTYRVFGRSNLYQGTRNDGWCIVEIGYKIIQ